MILFSHLEALQDLLGGRLDLAFVDSLWQGRGHVFLTNLWSIKKMTDASGSFLPPKPLSLSLFMSQDDLSLMTFWSRYWVYLITNEKLLFQQCQRGRDTSQSVSYHPCSTDKWTWMRGNKEGSVFITATFCPDFLEKTYELLCPILLVICLDEK